jgi:hypothetical protein
MNDDVLISNRLILCHYDTYSSALLFARFGSSVLAPAPLPEGAAAMSGAGVTGIQYEPATAVAALNSKFSLDAFPLSVVDGFEEWVGTDAGDPIRIHLARFTSFEAPREAIEPHGGVFKPISEMRGTPMIELNFLRTAFNLMMGGN